MNMDDIFVRDFVMKPKRTVHKGMSLMHSSFHVFDYRKSII